MHTTRLFVVLFSALLCFVPAIVLAQETKEEARLRLENELAEINKQIGVQQSLVQGKQQERQTLERDVAILDAQIEKAKLGIKASTIEIQNLGNQIGDKETVIGDLNEKLERQRQSLAQLLRRTDEIDDFTLVEVVLGSENLSAFFEDLDDFQAIKGELKVSFEEVRETKDDTFEQKTELEDRQQKEVELRRIQELEKQEVEKREAEKSHILSVTKGQEAAYQALLAQSQKTAAEIRAQLFQLSGGGGAIPFPEAVRLAKFASSKTGVRTALILGVLTQETKIGENLGVVGRWETDMHPTRDQPIFTVIMDTLGLDPNSMPVSPRPGYGWGGAMGPAQFIPSTWAIYGGYVKSGTTWVYDKSKDQIRSVSGKSSPSNPYDNQDAFIASALLMRDNGATAGTYAAERLAALRYFAGWGGASNPAYAFYGDGVMQHATRIESEIKILEGG